MRGVSDRPALRGATASGPIARPQSQHFALPNQQTAEHSGQTPSATLHAAFKAALLSANRAGRHIRGKPLDPPHDLPQHDARKRQSQQEHRQLIAGHAKLPRGEPAGIGRQPEIAGHRPQRGRPHQRQVETQRRDDDHQEIADRKRAARAVGRHQNARQKQHVAGRGKILQPGRKEPPLQTQQYAQADHRPRHRQGSDRLVKRQRDDLGHLDRPEPKTVIIEQFDPVEQPDAGDAEQIGPQFTLVFLPSLDDAPLRIEPIGADRIPDAHENPSPGTSSRTPPFCRRGPAIVKWWADSHCIAAGILLE
jgi:hypothetical protein